MYLCIQFVENDVSTERFPVIVRSREMLTSHVASFVLIDPAQRDLPRYQAGAHIEVDVRPGLLRRYSLCGDPADRQHYRIAVQLDQRSRGGSEIIHRDWQVGDLVTISEPRNNFPLTITNASTILAAGGIGITPILAMIFELLRQDRTFELHYTVRSPSLMAFRRQIEDCCGERAHLYFDDAAPESRFSASRLVENISKDAQIYVCGPAGFNAHVIRVAQQAGFPIDNLHNEAFAIQTSGMNDRSFSVQIASTGERYNVPADRTILEILDQSGVFVPNMCRQGLCGICITNVLSGQIDHRDDFLTNEERAKNNVILPCCSRASSSCLTLDL